MEIFFEVGMLLVVLINISYFVFVVHEYKG